MDLVTPGIGLIFWTTLVFLILLFMLKKFAWKPIMQAVKKREENIENALYAAEKAREEMKSLEFNNEQLLKEAKIKRDQLLKEAREVKEELIAEAKEQAKEVAERIITNAKESIHFEKMAAITDLKNQLAQLSVEIAEKVLEKELEHKEKQKQLIDSLLDNVNFN